MRNGDPVPASSQGSGVETSAIGKARTGTTGAVADSAGLVMMTEVSPFHCLYQDALEFHSQSRLMLPRSAGAASRMARASFLLYLGAADSLIHQAAVELGRPDLARLLADPARPLPTEQVWRMLPAIVADGVLSGTPNSAPWPQFAELLEVRTAWAFPDSRTRRAYYRAPYPGADYEPLQPHQVPGNLAIKAEELQFPRTGLPRDPYALRPHHLDTARGILDAAIEALDRLLDGALTRDNRHRREPIHVIHPPGRDGQ